MPFDYEASLTTDKPPDMVDLMRARANIEAVRVQLATKKYDKKDISDWATLADTVKTKLYDIDRFKEDLYRMERRRIHTVDTLKRLGIELEVECPQRDKLEKKLGLICGNLRSEHPSRS